MIRTLHFSCLRFALVPGFLALVSGCAPGQNQPAPAATASTERMMPGCGMMIDGKMVYSKSAPPECMTMNKPANMMPNGVTMHSDPAHK